MPTAAELPAQPSTPFRTRRVACLLIGVALALAGAAIALGWLTWMDEALHTGGLSSTPGVLWTLALLMFPAVWRITLLLRRGRRREAAYTAIGGGLAVILLVIVAMAVIAWAIGSAMPRG
ncbi:hypothetical protein SAMN05216570_3120 [Dyella sp. OK004]|uniref:hypothetical protein n=1 Tax=Dyella sp. OK004 TaxID=1855292 RepID=UPI0008F2DED1|nr:hypothetical protein [Dyella sp. OK004]SFS14601.1 hypothetical protein SAMN05216570_3120 [Dyella sp. OK004]